MMGPQWLSGCNASGGKKTVAGANKAGGEHLLTHVTGEGDSRDLDMAVTVYRERNQRVRTLSTVEHAQAAAFPLQQVSTTLTTLTANTQKLDASLISLTETMTGGSTVTTSAGTFPVLEDNTFVVGSDVYTVSSDPYARVAPLKQSDNQTFAAAQKAMAGYFEEWAGGIYRRNRLYGEFTA